MTRWVWIKNICHSDERFLRRKDFPTNRKESKVRSWTVFFIIDNNLLRFALNDSSGGKLLIPCYSKGEAEEFLILLTIIL